MDNKQLKTTQAACHIEKTAVELLVALLKKFSCKTWLLILPLLTLTKNNMTVLRKSVITSQYEQ